MPSLGAPLELDDEHWATWRLSFLTVSVSSFRLASSAAFVGCASNESAVPCSFATSTLRTCSSCAFASISAPRPGVHSASSGSEGDERACNGSTCVERCQLFVVWHRKDSLVGQIDSDLQV
eukprot:2200878-Rhodomonas_salina.1